MSWCDKNNISYIIGIARNSRIEKLTEPFIQQAKARFEKKIAVVQ